jgi:hypothetical protein
MEKEGNDRGEQEEKGNNKRVIGRTARRSNKYQRKTHKCKSLQVTFQRITGAVILCHEDITRE